MSSFVITNADIGTLTKEAQYSINQQITHNQGGTWSLTQTSAGLSFAGTDFCPCGMMTNSVFLQSHTKTWITMIWWTTSMIPTSTHFQCSPMIAVIITRFFDSSHKFDQIRQDLTIFGCKTNHLTYIFQALAPAWCRENGRIQMTQQKKDLWYKPIFVHNFSFSCCYYVPWL